MSRAGRILPPEVAAKALTAYNARRRRWLTDPVAAESDALTVGLNPPSESQVAADPDAVRAWVRAWREYTGVGEVEWSTRRWPSFGTQDVPIRVLLPGADTIASAAGRGGRWRQLLARRTQLGELADGADTGRGLEPSRQHDGERPLQHGGRPSRPHDGEPSPQHNGEPSRQHDGESSRRHSVEPDPAGCAPDHRSVGVPVEPNDREPSPLAAAIAATAKAWDALDDTDFDRLRAVLRWLRDHPDSGLLIRQVPVPGVDTKWLGRHRTLVESLLAGIRGGDGDLGVRTLPRLLEIAVLDRTLLPGAPRVFAAALDALAALPLRPATVLVLENKEGVHALPDLPGVVAVHGGGYAVHELAALPWLADTTVRYWGDLDSHGFAILDRLRHHLPDVRSLLMDRDTLERWRELAVTEPAPATGECTRLSGDEAATLACLRAGSLRLEQERIPWPYAMGRIEEVVARQR